MKSYMRENWRQLAVFSVLVALTLLVGVDVSHADALIGMGAVLAVRTPPALRNLGNYDVNRAGAVEALWQPLYDYGPPTADNYAAAGQTSLTFFQQPIGQASKTLADTNMDTAGSLPNPKQQLITNVQVMFWPAASLVARSGLAAAALDADFLKDVYTVSKAGWLEIFVGSKPYLDDGPMGVFPPLTRLAGWGCNSISTTADTNGSEQAYAAFAGAVYEITPIRLISQQNFKVTLNWPTAVALPSGVAARIGIRLGGFQYRLSQ